ncbi:hypothetical protein H0H92_006643 [Tricholoma furcatifolium]|nr:hypothetical protein H0H92_006643 [Tricholoma furcatifolium]
MATVGRRGRRRGKLRFITEMPMDILYETFSYLQPADLLRLSRANKTLRSTVLNRRANYIWKQVFLNVEDNPPPTIPADMTYPNYTLLLYGTDCYGQMMNDDPVTALVLSLCPSWMIYKSAQKTEEAYYLKEDVVRIADEVDPILDNDELFTEYYESRFAQNSERMKHALECELWAGGQKMIRKTELETLRMRRKDAICDRLQDEVIQWAGWGPELDYLGPDYDFFGLPGVNKPQLLTDRIWSNIYPNLFTFFEETREERIKAERNELIASRLRLLAPLYDDFIAVDFISTQSRRNPLPGFADIFTQQPFRSLIFDIAPDILLTEAHFNVYTDKIREISTRWIRSSSEVLRALLPPEQCLTLATVFFRCRWCCKAISYPRVLKHSCLVTDHYDFDPDGGEEMFNLTCFTERPWNRGRSQVTFDEEAAVYAKEAIEICGADPRTATVNEMEAMDCRLQCMRCRAKYGRRVYLTWSAAIDHMIAQHQGPGWRDFKGPGWKLLQNEEMLALVKANEMEVRTVSWRKLGCQHCGLVENSYHSLQAHVREV